MGREEIAELERLASSDELICRRPYSNPARERELLFDYIRGYGSDFEIDVGRHRFGFFEDIRFYYSSLKNALSNTTSSPSLRLTLGAFEAFSLIIRPLAYPLAGGTARCNVAGDIVRICTPNYEGIFGLFFDTEAHELQHAYHYISYLDLYSRGLMTTDCFSGIPLIEPGVRVPTKPELKNFERRYLRWAIKNEKKALSEAARA